MRLWNSTWLEKGKETTSISTSAVALVPNRAGLIGIIAASPAGGQLSLALAPQVKGGQRHCPPSFLCEEVGQFLDYFLCDLHWVKVGGEVFRRGRTSEDWGRNPLSEVASVDGPQSSVSPHRGYQPYPLVGYGLDLRRLAQPTLHLRYRCNCGSPGMGRGSRAAVG